MNKKQLIILWIGAFVFLFCLWNPAIIPSPPAGFTHRLTTIPPPPDKRLVDLGPADRLTTTSPLSGFTQDVTAAPEGFTEEVNPGESSIATVGVPDTDTLMSDGFDMEKHIGPEKSAQLDLTGDKNEALSDLKISTFLQNMGVQQENINAADIMLKAQADEQSSGVWDSVRWEEIFEESFDAQLLRLTSVTVLTALLVYSYSDKNKTKFKEILQQLTGLKPKSGDVEKKGK